jgi:hypothetical protein
VSVQPAACPSTSAVQTAKPAKLARTRMRGAVRSLPGPHARAAQEPGAASQHAARSVRARSCLGAKGVPEAAALEAMQMSGTQGSDSRGVRPSAASHGQRHLQSSACTCYMFPVQQKLNFTQDCSPEGHTTTLSSVTQQMRSAERADEFARMGRSGRQESMPCCCMHMLKVRNRGMHMMESTHTVYHFAPPSRANSCGQP